MEGCLSLISPVESDLHVEPGCVLAIIQICLSCLRQGWRVTLDQIILHDRRIHIVSVVKDALCSPEAHVHEVFTFNSDLSVALDRTACWVYLGDPGCIVVEERDLP